MESAQGRHSVQFLGNSQESGHTVYMIKVVSPDGDTWNVRKRYSDIRDLHDQLRLRHGDTLPLIPGKRLFGNNDPAFIAQRQAGLQQYLDGVLRMERDVRTPALLQFLGGPQPGGERNTGRQYQQIVDAMQNNLLNLALPPAPLDETEMSQRLKKYGQAMRLHVLSQPVDPIHLRAPGFDGEPPQFCASNAERLETLKAAPPPGGGTDGKVLNDFLDGLFEVLRPTQPIADPEKLIVAFPHVSIPGRSAS